MTLVVGGLAAAGGVVVLLLRPYLTPFAAVLAFMFLGSQPPGIVVAVIAGISVLGAVGSLHALRLDPPVVLMTLLFVAFGAFQVAILKTSTLQIPIRWVTMVAMVVVLLITARHWRSLDDPGRVKFVLLFCSVVGLQAVLAVSQALLRRPVVPSSFISASVEDTSLAIPGMYRAAGTLPHPNALALLLTMAVGLLLVVLPISRGRDRSVSWVVLGTLVAGTLATLSRSGLLTLGIVLLCFYFMQRRRRIWRLSSSVIVVAGMFALAIAAAARFRGSTAALARDSSSNDARLSNLRAAVSAFEDSPLVGQGFGAGAEYGREFGGYAGLGAHNTYLDVLSGGGLFLFFLLVGAGVVVWRGRPPGGDLVTGVRRRLFIPALCAVTVASTFESILQSGFVVVLGVLGGIIAATGRTTVTVNGVVDAHP